ncbi:MAG: LysM domain-containing protein [Chloroflexi bacterium CFX7]|nr:MAG: LysM domain-containing protein [bacterium]MCE7929507.1 LysM domain-containing protein [Chloroflexi bacterium CFX7]MCK6563602.1 LysM peptidoglycan-binding domain-containing protein [Dehalococcoidia bacterium]MCL4232581.1 LysM peptidoglycan-binding domain-containing protein [Dehalococcoidia bacterium]
MPSASGARLRLLSAPGFVLIAAALAASLAAGCGGGDGEDKGTVQTRTPASGNTPSPGGTPTVAASPSPAGSASPSPSPSPGGTAVSGSTYIVKAGDTLWDLAVAWGVTVEAIVAANNLASPDDLSIGQELKVP